MLCVLRKYEQWPFVVSHESGAGLDYILEVLMAEVNMGDGDSDGEE